MSNLEFAGAFLPSLYKVCSRGKVCLFNNWFSSSLPSLSCGFLCGQQYSLRLILGEIYYRVLAGSQFGERWSLLSLQ